MSHLSKQEIRKSIDEYFARRENVQQQVFAPSNPTPTRDHSFSWVINPETHESEITNQPLEEYAEHYRVASGSEQVADTSEQCGIGTDTEQCSIGHDVEQTGRSQDDYDILAELIRAEVQQKLALERQAGRQGFEFPSQVYEMERGPSGLSQYSNQVIDKFQTLAGSAEPKPEPPKPRDPNKAMTARDHADRLLWLCGPLPAMTSGTPKTISPYDSDSEPAQETPSEDQQPYETPQIQEPMVNLMATPETTGQTQKNSTLAADTHDHFSRADKEKLTRMEHARDADEPAPMDLSFESHRAAYAGLAILHESLRATPADTIRLLLENTRHAWKIVSLIGKNSSAQYIDIRDYKLIQSVLEACRNKKVSKSYLGFIFAKDIMCWRGTIWINHSTPLYITPEAVLAAMAHSSNPDNIEKILDAYITQRGAKVCSELTSTQARSLLPAWLLRGLNNLAWSRSGMDGIKILSSRGLLDESQTGENNTWMRAARGDAGIDKVSYILHVMRLPAIPEEAINVAVRYQHAEFLGALYALGALESYRREEILELIENY